MALSKQQHLRTASHSASAVVVAAAFLLSVLLASPAVAQTYTILHTFTGGADGDSPYAGLTMDHAGNLYGTTSDGGSRCRTCGTVFKLEHKNSGWVFYTLYSFSGPDGANPQARVSIGPDGNLYGTTTYGGAANNGVVFRLQPPPSFCRAFSCPWTETVLYSFEGGGDGAQPTYGDLTFDAAGNIYGTTPTSGGHGCGMVYELSPSNGHWTETILYRFQCGEDGNQPYAGVIFDSTGNLYGTTAAGGASGEGVVYKLTNTGSGWSETTIHSFDSNSISPYGGLIFDAHGNLYGMTGLVPIAVYRLSPTDGGWDYTALYTFTDVYGSTATPAMDAAGNLYGTIFIGTPEIFRLSPTGNQWILTGFSGGVGEEPLGSVVVDAAGNVYGTASSGYVFEITP